MFTDYRKNDIFVNHLSAYLPNFVLREAQHGRWVKNAFSLFIDIDGFTQLSEEYGTREHSGVDELTTELNRYLSKIVNCIHRFNGDIVHFAGDAVFSIWEDGNHKDSNDNDEYSTDDSLDSELTWDLAWNVIDCALQIHGSCDFYKTKLGKVLTLKTAIAYGQIEELILCHQKCSSFYFVYGSSIEELQAVEQQSERTKVYMTESAWRKLISVLKAPHFPFLILSGLTSSDIPISIYAVALHTLENESVKRKYNITQNRRFSMTAHERIEQYLNRNLSWVQETVDNSKLRSFLRSFVTVGHAIARIENGESVERLSELRHISSSFLNFDFIQQFKISDSFIQILAQLLDDIEKVVKQYQGTILKITTFDKGWSTLIVFGLPDEDLIIHSREFNKSKDALICCYQLQQMILSDYRDSIAHCSIGVTTGLAYCGVIGHKSRHEYTCIGTRINMSARLMSNYVNYLSCDEETYWLSKISPDCFLNLPTVYLKGIGIQKVRSLVANPQKIENNLERRQSGSNLDEQHAELFFGHKVELFIICAAMLSNVNLLQDFMPDDDSLPEDEDLETSNKRNVFVFECDVGSGKSSFVEYLNVIFNGSEKINTIVIHLAEPDKIKPLDGVKCIVNALANFITSRPNMTTIKISEMTQNTLLSNIQVILQSISTASAEVSRRSSYQNTSNKRLSENDIEDVLGNVELDSLLGNDITYLLYKTIRTLHAHFFLIIIDDMHFVDNESLQIISRISACKNTMIVSTTLQINALSETRQVDLVKFINNCEFNKIQILHSNEMQLISNVRPLLTRITPLSLVEMFQTICQHFEVVLIEDTLLDQLYRNFKFYPVVCIGSIEELIFRKKIQHGKVLGNKRYYFVDDLAEIYARKRKQKNVLQHIFERPPLIRKVRVNDSFDDTQSTYLALSLTKSVTTKFISTSVESFLHHLYDSLSSNEKIVLDAFSSLGRSISRVKLRGVCTHFMTKHEYILSIQRLMSSHVLKCAREKQRQINVRKIKIVLGDMKAYKKEDNDMFMPLDDSRDSTEQANINIKCYCPENNTDIAFMCKFFTFSMDWMRWSLYNRQTASSRRQYLKCSLEWMESLESELFCEHCAVATGYFCVFDLQTVNRRSYSGEKSLSITDIESVVRQMQIKKVEDDIKCSVTTHDIDFALMLKDQEAVRSTKKTSVNATSKWRRIGADILLHSIMYGTHSMSQKVTMISESDESQTNEVLRRLRTMKFNSRKIKFKSMIALFFEESNVNEIAKLQNLKIDSISDEIQSTNMQDDFEDTKSNNLLAVNLDDILISVNTLLSKKQNCYDQRECQCDLINYTILNDLINCSESIGDQIRVAFYTDQLAIFHLLNNKLPECWSCLSGSGETLLRLRKLSDQQKPKKKVDDYTDSADEDDNDVDVEFDSKDHLKMAILFHEMSLALYYNNTGDYKASMNKCTENLNVLMRSNSKRLNSFVVVMFLLLFLENSLQYPKLTISRQLRRHYLTKVVLLITNQSRHFVEHKKYAYAVDNLIISLTFIIDHLFEIGEEVLACNMCNEFYNTLQNSITCGHQIQKKSLTQMRN